MVAYGEYYSTHPIAKSILKAYKGKIDEGEIKNYKEVSGYGVKATVFLKKLIIGNEKLFREEDINIPEVKAFGTVVYVALDDKYIGYLVIGDKVKKSANNLVSNLKKLGVNRVVMFSGDNYDMVCEVAHMVNIDEYYAQLLPIDKVSKLKDIKKDSFTAFVGDGINDAPVIKEANLGISMGGIGSDAAIEASDIVLMHDNLEKILEAIKIARMTKGIITFNIVFALFFKF